MKYLVLAIIILIAVVGIARADINYVDGYYRSNGSYVSGHYKDTSADGNPYNNRGYLWGY